MLTDLPACKSNLELPPRPCDARWIETIEHWFQPWPLGELCIATSPLGVRRITWAENGDRDEVRTRLATELTGARLAERTPDTNVRHELDQFFEGERRRFELPVDPRPTSAFQERVLRRLMHTRFGETVTYGDLAASVGKPGASRAVGRVMATNPLPIVIPCHRVLPADHSLGRYTGGVKVKEFLLALEGVRFGEPRLSPDWG